MKLKNRVKGKGWDRLSTSGPRKTDTGSFQEQLYLNQPTLFQANVEPTLAPSEKRMTEEARVIELYEKIYQNDPEMAEKLRQFGSEIYKQHTAQRATSMTKFGEPIRKTTTPWEATQIANTYSQYGPFNRDKFPSEQAWLEDQDSGMASDFRHQLAAALITKKYGPWAARLLGYANELASGDIGGLFNGGVKKDLQANEAGIKKAKGYKGSDADLINDYLKEFKFQDPLGDTTK